MLWTDNMMVPAMARHKNNAERLMDWYYDPQIAAELAAWVQYICPVAGAQEEMEKIDPSLVDNPLIFPTEDDLTNVHDLQGAHLLGAGQVRPGIPVPHRQLTAPASTGEHQPWLPRTAAKQVEDLHLVRLTKRYGDHAAVDDLSLTIPAGSFFALLGPSGCGKTTTLRMVAGLEVPTAGMIRVGEQDITALRPYKRPVNTVFQSYALFPHMDIFENVAFGLRRRGEKNVDAQGQRDARARRARDRWRAASPPRCPAASSSAWPWPAP